MCERYAKDRSHRSEGDMRHETINVFCVPPISGG